MTLLEAINSNKKFTRETSLLEGEMHYYDADEYLECVTKEDIAAIDFVLMPEELTSTLLMEIWNRNKSMTTPSASESKFFSKLLLELKTKGFVTQ